MSNNIMDTEKAFLFKKLTEHKGIYTIQAKGLKPLVGNKRLGKNVRCQLGEILQSFGIVYSTIPNDERQVVELRIPVLMMM